MEIVHIAQHVGLIMSFGFLLHRIAPKKPLDVFINESRLSKYLRQPLSFAFILQVTETMIKWKISVSQSFKQMRITLILILFPYCIYCQQNKFTGFIIDNFGNPIQYVNVVSLKNLSGTVTDSQGFFSISVSKDDTIKLSHIAYSSKIIPINKLSSDTVTLDESLITIGEVVIKSRVNILNLSKLGFYNKDKNGEFLLKPGNQIAVFIDNPKNTPALIKSITFEVKRKGKCNSTLRLRILENQDGKIIPGKDILKENYLFNNSILTKSNTVDISKSRIFIPKEGVFIVVEWISDEIDCNLKSFPSLGANISTKENLVWYNYRDRKWSKPKESRMPNGNFMTPNISMKVYY